MKKITMIAFATAMCGLQAMEQKKKVVLPPIGGILNAQPRQQSEPFPKAVVLPPVHELLNGQGQKRDRFAASSLDSEGLASDAIQSQSVTMVLQAATKAISFARKAREQSVERSRNILSPHFPVQAANSNAVRPLTFKPPYSREKRSQQQVCFKVLGGNRAYYYKNTIH